MSNMLLNIVILAAGEGKRMQSNTSKVLHNLGGIPMLQRVVETGMALNPASINVIIGHGAEQVKQALSSYPINWIVQTTQSGTGHAVLQALPSIPSYHQVLVLCADVPLIQTHTLQSLIDSCQPKSTDDAPLGLLVASVPQPTGLGRIVRDDNHHIQAIVEEKDASPEQHQIKEIYSGICCVSALSLHRWLPKLTNSNAQKEYYLTGIIAMAVEEQVPIVSIEVTDLAEIAGVNNRVQLQQLERSLQMRLSNQLMLDGVTLADAARIDIRGELSCGMDVYIDVNNVFEGQVVLGNSSTIGANCVLKNVTLGAFCDILPNSILEDCVIADNCQIGPFARLRPGTRLAEKCKIGNFVEVKNAVFDVESKANHLSYIGDATIGKQVNIGAGTITCNYDGANKHQTVIEDGVFIGSDTQLVAPITVGANATIGAGSTIRKDVPSDELTLTVSKQRTISGWVRPSKSQEKI